MSSINSKETTNAAYGSVQVDEAAMKLVQKEAVNAIQFSQQKMADLKKYVEDGGIISFFIGIFVSGLGIVLFLAGRQAI
eukprot:gene8894-11889_t